MQIEGNQVCHSCDTPSCVNPNHLFISDQAGNIQDKVNKNRQAKGEINGASKLSELEVLEILSLHSEGFSQKEIAIRFHTSKYAIWRIVSGNGWKHLISQQQ